MKKVVILIAFILCGLLFVFLGMGCGMNPNVYRETASVHLLRDITVECKDEKDVQIVFHRNSENELILESSDVYVSGEVYGSYEYILDENYNVVSVKESGEQGKIHEINFSYNSHGRVSQMRVQSEDGSLYNVSFEYDNNGWQKKISVTDVEGDLLSYFICSRDESEYKEKVSEYNAEGILQSYYENVYVHDSKLAKSIKYEKSGKEVYTMVLGYFQYEKSITVIGSKED